jgi:peptidoglycan/LPS O-acetylase OafA/YrhL
MARQTRVGRPVARFRVISRGIEPRELGRDDGGRGDSGSILRRRLRRLAAAVAVAGLVVATVIYFAAGPAAENPLGYDPLDTKTYVHDLELYGGKANVLAAEFREWFVGLWQGRDLAFTVGAITLFLVLVIRWIAARLPSRPVDDAEEPVIPPGA